MPNDKRSEKVSAATLAEMPGAGFYRCPVCGAVVDGRKYESFRIHHEHMLHPDRFRFTSSTTTPAAGKSSAGRGGGALS